MKKRTIARILALMLVLVMAVPSGCSRKEEKQVIEVDDGINEGITSLAENVSQSDVSAEVILDNENEEVIAKLYPAEAADEYLYGFVKELDADALLNPDDITGDMFAVVGTVTGTADFTKYVEMFGATEDLLTQEQLEMVNTYIVSAFGEEMVFVDILPLLVDSVKSEYADDLISMKAIKCRYNNLKVYKDYPETGEKVRICGQYWSYSEKMNAHVFVYGMSLLAHSSCFGLDYEKYRSDSTTHYKYKNYYEIDYPAMWGDVNTSGETGMVYNNCGTMECDYWDPIVEGDLKANVDGYKTQWGLDQDFVTLTNEEYFELPCGKECYRAGFTYLTETGSPMSIYVAVFEHKHKLMVLWYYDYMTGDHSDLYLEDFWKTVASVQPCGI